MDDQTSPKLIGFDTPAPPRRRNWTRLIIGLLLVIGLIAAGVLYWLDARHYESTDDAFIDGHISQVSAQVAGRITQLLVDDNQSVTAGQVLAIIDPRDTQVRVDQMQASRDQALAQLAQANATLGVRQAELAQDAANIRMTQTDVVQSGRDLARYNSINPHAITAQALDQARAAAGNAAAHLDANRQAEAAARAQLSVAHTQVTAAEAGVRTADANLEQARLQLTYTRITAPAAGRIARRTVELGLYVTAGQALLAIVQPACWVTANLKENQLARLKPGQPATIRVDAFPDQSLPAHVDSVQSGTGSVFSSLPAENATGNYVKIVQRLPIKLTFDNNDCDRLHLAPGMSVEPKIKVW